MTSAESIRTITPTVARRLAIARQRLAGPRPAATHDGVLGVVRALGCLQLDPISVVARSHHLVLYSRLGPGAPTLVDDLLERERRLFEYWAHAASIVLTEDYQLHQPMMATYTAGGSAHHQRVRAWLSDNAALREHILTRLRDEGPLLSRQFEPDERNPWVSSGWTSGRTVSRMLDYLWLGGEILVAGRQGGQKRWDLAERVLPPDTPRAPLPSREVVRRAVERSLRALGVARPDHISRHFIRGRYPGLAAVLRDLQAEGRIVPLAVADDGVTLPGQWYIHADDLALADRLAGPDWQPRTALLSPFDNLICDRARTEQLFDFRFRIEIYTPAAKRQYGYYVLPVLHGDRLIGRVDPAFDRRRSCLTVNAIFTEPGALADAARVITAAIEDLAACLEARTIDYPAGWTGAGSG
jgi:uncharacterized protein YcaQ